MCGIRSVDEELVRIRQIIKRIDCIQADMRGLVDKGSCAFQYIVVGKKRGRHPNPFDRFLKLAMKISRSENVLGSIKKKQRQIRFRTADGLNELLHLPQRIFHVDTRSSARARIQRTEGCVECLVYVFDSVRPLTALNA